MSEESFILVNLKEDKAKKLAQVISNKTSREILDYLSKIEASETKISKELNLPLSTVHYNIQHLLRAQLITSEEFKYSVKGKVMPRYKVTNKFVILAPETVKSESIKQKLMKILPISLLAFVGSGIIYLYDNIQLRNLSFGLQAPQSENFDQALAPLAEKTSEVTQISSEPNVALWFLFGALFVIIVGFIVSLFKKN